MKYVRKKRIIDLIKQLKIVETRRKL